MTLVQLLFAVLLVLANGFFVGAEFALVSVRRSQIEPLATEGSTRARQVLHGLENLPQMMAAAQFGITVCSLTLGAVAEPTVAHLLEPLFEAVHLPAALVHPLGYVIALALVVFLHLVIGEMVPKNLAMAAPEKTALWFSPGLVAFARLCRPVTALLGACARGVLRLFRVEPKDEVEAVFTSEQLTHLVEDAGQAGLLEPAEQEQLSDVLELGSRPVTDVLLDRAGLVTVEPTVTPRQVEELTVRTGYSRFPVCAPGGAYMGYLHVKDVLDLEERDRAVPQRIWHPMTTLRAELPLDDALTAMRRAASHLAAVADATGRVLGLVALEDVLEMLVGEVRDPAHRRAPAARSRRAAEDRVGEPREEAPLPAEDRALAG
ncbi:hemolysin family protein [Streptomyces libani]|uniref:Hemolysin family protein n=2 Tax=Streptomyces nigrescens TaxID=1920 RepID=A0A640TQQ7_STRNI|nr:MULTISPECIES: hemolysin family protein [Streptomyces]MCR8574558.1 hemolysin family protein [Streptomyces sp. Isolate_219]MCX5449531.1 hemolysin family protein [Streptomyces libani]WAU00255.1 hemolysin family protein [Streptomyces libani subsp. libani]WAU08147.1 hemolysin family protein [Streptomyces nigrescens]GFE25510.1 membrane protein [Streptomyces libani subsp. libani]